jgi:hypothetical protein
MISSMKSEAEILRKIALQGVVFRLAEDAASTSEWQAPFDNTR